MSPQDSIIVDGIHLECRWVGPPPQDAPTLVLLHEGLGSVKLWRNFPEQLAAATGMGVFAYSRPGYGASDPKPLPWPITYMEEHATTVLPGVLDAIGLQDGLLIGHSDGASIAALYAAGTADERLKGCVLMAPHFFVEQICIDAIQEAKVAFEQGPLRQRLSLYHGQNVDNAFYGWNSSWLDDDFRHWDITSVLGSIQVPMLVLQGLSDPYGTAAHAEAAERLSPMPVTTRLMEGVGHTPWREAAEETLDAIQGFAAGLFPTK